MGALKVARGERRKHQRRKTIGSVYFWWNEAVGREARGTLLDESEGGFRARHTCRELAAGQLVGIRLGGVEGRARVAWTRVTGDVVESGFMVLTGRPDEESPPSRA
jgi:hypothetical protein